MIIPKIDKNTRKQGQIEYPHVSTWGIIKEYAKLWKLQAGGFASKSIEELLEV